MDFSNYLPHIDVAEGKARVINNLDLYKTLLKKFKGRQMTDELLDAIKINDIATIAQTAHALRGTAGNLSLPALLEVSSEIEKLGKAGQDCSHLSERLDKVMTDLEKSIEELAAS